jgi:hypothetical protein
MNSNLHLVFHSSTWNLVNDVIVQPIVVKDKIPLAEAIEERDELVILQLPGDTIAVARTLLNGSDYQFMAFASRFPNEQLGKYMVDYLNLHYEMKDPDMGPPWMKLPVYKCTGTTEEMFVVLLEK